MSREILFKAVSVEGEWVEGDLVHIRNSKCVETIGIKDTIYHVNDGYINLIPTEILPETVCQFTGRIDVTFRRIFEGDRAKLHHHTAIYVCKWDKVRCAFLWVCEVTNETRMLTEEATIIGNIYEGKVK